MYATNKQSISQLARTDHYSNLDIDTIDHGKIIDCTTHHVCQEITVGGQDGVAVDGDDEHAGGGGAYRRRLRQTLFFLFLISASLRDENAEGTSFIVAFRSKQVGSRKNQVDPTSEVGKSIGGTPP